MKLASTAHLLETLPAMQKINWSYWIYNYILYININVLARLQTMDKDHVTSNSI